MKKIKNANLSLYMLILSASIFIFGVIFGSLYDLKIAQTIYHPHNFVSYYTEYVGTLPAAVIFSLSGILLFLYFKHNKKIKGASIYQYLSLLFVLLAGVIWGYDTLNNHLPNKIYAVLIGIVVIIPFSYLFYLDLKRKYSNDFLRLALIIICSTLLSFILTFGLKYLIVRPRFYYLLDIDRLDLFKNWYSFSIDKSIYPSVTDSTFIQSWPSGHSNFASLNHLILIFPFIKKNKVNKHLIYTIITIYSILIMAGRMIDGHHFLSDVSFGYFIGTASCYLFMITLSKKEKTNIKVNIDTLTNGLINTNL